jgi:hypothetical protein
MTAGRNDPCPCGSGRKYKKCHYASDTAARAAERADTVSPVHEQDHRVVEDIVNFVAARFDADLLEELDRLDSYPLMSPQFGAPWLAYVAEFDGRTAVDWYLTEREWSLTRGTIEWLTAQKASWLSMWEVLDVEPGRHIVMRDLLTFTERTVHEVSASRTIERGFVTLCRVVDFGGISVICGMHQSPLGPVAGERAVERIRAALRRKSVVPPERLRNVRMLDAWSDELDALSAPRTLVNTEGDLILLTTDRWRFDGASRDALAARIDALEGIQEDGDDHFVFLREEAPDDVTVTGHLIIEEGTLELQTNSVARADALVARIESACGDLLKAHTRVHTDPVAMLNSGDAAGPAPKRENTAEELAFLREFKTRHYRKWADDALPALDGETPRAMVRTASGRRHVEKLVQEIEMIEARESEGARFDVNELRRELGLLS